MTQGMVRVQISFNCQFQMLPYYCYSYACAIDLGQTVVITGGHWTMRRVTEYNEDGQTKELPKLDRGRRSHGCASYVDKENRIVMIFTTFVRRCNTVI